MRASPLFAAGVVRALAVAIAIAAVVDPAISISGDVPPRVAVVVQDPGLPAASAAEATVREVLGRSHEIVPQITSDVAAAIVIGDRYPDEELPANLVVATVTTAKAALVRISRLGAPGAVPRTTAMRLEAEIDAFGVAGRSSDLVMTIGGLEVGRLSYRWGLQREVWHAVVDAVPVGDAPWVVRASVVTPDAATSVADAVVSERREPLAVQIYEPRPSWATNFVRRALEADARFRVESLMLSSRGVSTRTPGSVALDSPQLDTFDVVVVGGVERLSAGEVRALDRFMRVRGGAVALLPDVRVGAGAVRDLLPMQMTERLLERPERLSMMFGAAPIDASELLMPRGPNAARSDVVARATDGSPVIVSMPNGRGRLFVSGAMDAWRYRAAADRAFDRFWRATLAGLALGAQPPVDLSVSPPLLTPRQRAELSVTLRGGAEAVEASVGGETVRLWPEPEPGAFRGSFTAGATAGRMAIEVSAAGGRPYTVAREVVVREDAVTPARTAAPLSLLAESHRGIDVSADRLGELERFIRERITGADAVRVRRPMRSNWWLLPFASALCVEWAVRRRRGLR
jgi:hypothetical protein